MTRAGGEKRGNNRDRYARKTWMLFLFGDGIRVECTHCECTLIRTTLEADRIVSGSSYQHMNIQPSCRNCNAARNNDPEWIAPKNTKPSFW
jgi:hypothetical protein